jgi:hypothetical protein
MLLMLALLNPRKTKNRIPPGRNPMNDSKRVIYAIFLAFFCLILGSWFVIRAGEILLVFIGTLFAASGATFFFVFFFKK